MFSSLTWIASKATSFLIWRKNDYVKKLTFLSIIFCFLICSFVEGQSSLPPAYHIHSDMPDFIILADSNWQAMADINGNLSLSQVINSGEFNSHIRKIDYDIPIYWLRLRIVNNTIADARLSLPEEAWKADLYTSTNEGSWKHFVSGSGIPWSRREGLKRIPAFTIIIPGGDTVLLYKKVQFNFVFSKPDSLKMALARTDKLIEKSYINDNQTETTAIQDAFILGMFILSILINFYFFLVVREKEFLYFCLFLLLFSIEAVCSLNDFFLRDSPQLVLYLYIISNSLSSFFMLHFVRYFLKTFRRFSRLDKYLTILSFAYVAIILSSAFASAVFHTNVSEWSHISENTMKLLYGVSILATLLLFIGDKDRNNRFVAIALIPILLLQVFAYTIAIIFGLYYPRLGTPPISGYQSVFTRTAFFLLIICYLWMMIFFTWMLFQRFSHLRKELEQQESLDHLKSRFFANISHEFRTPLTLIIGPAEDLLQDKNALKFKEPLSYIQRNAKRLLQLINQLLDLSRLDAGNYEVNTTRQDIIPFVKQIVRSFSSMAHHKNILLETELDTRLKDEIRNEKLTFYFDEDILEKILFNLLSNAFKFTPDGGNITVSISLSENNLLELRVEDDGSGIPPDKLPFIFDRFYQADNSYKRQYGGTGIGLSLVKELVELHGGTITAQSGAGQQTVFNCYFPFNNKMISKKALPEISTRRQMKFVEDPEFNEKVIMPDRSKATLLVVEDQQDVRKYITDKLSDSYTVIEGKNGKEGFEMAKQQMPQLIISDVMMPIMDGFEFCAALKNDDVTSHIPVILLTARAEDSDKLSGLETGADAYLIKPFNAKELLLRVHNLIVLRSKLRKKFSGKLIVKPSEITVTSQDSRFMQRLLDTVEKHISDEKFSVEQLGHEFGMSTSQINRKLKALVNQSAGAFIRSVRMQRAMELLKNDQATIAEVAYETGFTEPAYFSRVFKAYFGYPPSEVKK